MNLRLLIARHGQTDWNQQRRIQGRTNVPLNDNGRRQAVKLAQQLAGVQLDCIYSSFLVRSVQTAEALSGMAHRVPLSGLDERSLGVFEGRYLDGREPGLVEDYRRRIAEPDDSLDGGESLRQHGQRVGLTLEMIMARHNTGTVMLVGHGATNDAILGRLLGLSFTEARALHQKNGQVYLLEVASDRQPKLFTRFKVAGGGELVGRS